MMHKLFLFSAILFFVSATAFAQTKVYLIPTLHGLHKTNTAYNYDTLKAIITRIQPDVIAVEIRPEEATGDTAYLKKNYPFEMWMQRYWFPAVTIEGFDWLGQELEGKVIPERYWKEASRIKYLERRLDIDSVYSAKAQTCDVYRNDRLPILQTQSLKGILSSNDAILIKAYYDCLNGQLQGSDYAELTQFYNQRNQKMQERLLAITQKHAGKTIAVLTGDDHYPYLLEYLRKQKVQVLHPGQIP